MADKYRIIESEKIKVKLINGTEVLVRPLTLAERRECISLIPKNLRDDSVNYEKFTDMYIRAQGDILLYILQRENPKFTKDDVDTQLDSSLIKRIIDFTLKDPFNELI